MSRTYRDSLRAKHRKSRKQRWETKYYQEEYLAERYEYDYKTWTRQYLGELVLRKVTLQRGGVLPKQKRSFLNQGHYWYKYTPSWYTREFMTRPKRARCRAWEKRAASCLDLDDLDDCPDYGRKPHVYYY